MQGHSLAVGIVRGCWLVFVAVWAFAAISTKRSVYRESRAQRQRYWLLFVIACLMMIYGRQMPYPLNLRIVPHGVSMEWAAAVLCVFGLFVALWARAILGRNWSGTVTLKEGHELVQDGPYRFVRHPIYTGMLTMFVATALLQGHLAGFAGVLLLFGSFWIKLGFEENLMLQQFPDRYAAYREQTKRIIPFVL